MVAVTLRAAYWGRVKRRKASGTDAYLGKCRQVALHHAIARFLVKVCPLAPIRVHHRLSIFPILKKNAGPRFGASCRAELQRI